MSFRVLQVVEACSKLPYFAYATYFITLTSVSLDSGTKLYCQDGYRIANIVICIVAILYFILELWLLHALWKYAKLDASFFYWDSLVSSFAIISNSWMIFISNAYVNYDNVRMICEEGDGVSIGVMLFSIMLMILIILKATYYYREPNYWRL